MAKRITRKQVWTALEARRQWVMNGHRRRVAELDYRYERDRQESMNTAVLNLVGFVK